MKPRNSDDLKAIKVMKYILYILMTILFVICVKVHDETVSSESESWIYSPVANNLSFKQQ